MSLFFINLALLGGLAALAIPVLIHLLLKRKKQKLRFSTLQFFRKLDEEASKRRKLRNWLLLATRLLLVTLLVLAFARPYLKNSLAGGDLRKRRVAVFVLDRSLSMTATGTGGEHWKRAVELVRKTLGEFKSDDMAALVSCSTRTGTLSPLKPPSVIARMVDDLAPTSGKSDLAEGLQQALKLLPPPDNSSAHTIYLVSDLQRSAAQQLATASVPQDVEVKTLHAGELFTPNLAVTDFRIEGQVQPRASVLVKSFSDEDASALKLSLLVDGKETSVLSISLKPGAETNLVVSLPALKPGWHSCEARLQTKDALIADNTRFHALYVPEPVGVLCVEPKRTSRIFEEESFYVTSALDPAQGTTNDVPALFAVEKAFPEDIAAKLSAAGGKTSYRLLVLPRLTAIPDGCSQAITAFVRNGGGLLMFLGDGLSANRYNAEFRDLLPARIDRIEGDANAGWRLGEFEKTSPLFAPFQGPLSVNLMLPEFQRRCVMTPAEASSVAATFEDSAPLVLTKSVGAGRVVLVNTSADASWSDWPKRKSFVPWLHATANYLAGRSTADTIRPATAYLVGEAGEIELGPTAKSSQFVLKRTGTSDVTVNSGDDGFLPLPETTAPGVYSLRDHNDREVRRWVVNVPAQESELAAFSPKEFEKQIIRGNQPRPVTLEAKLFNGASGQRELWRVLLLAALGLLFLEVMLANRTTA